MRLTVVGVRERGLGSLSESLARGAAASGHDVAHVDAGWLVEGRRPLIAARRLDLPNTLASPLVRRLERQLAALEPDLTLVVKGRFLERHAVERLRKSARCPIVNYYPDDPFWPGYAEAAVQDALLAYDEVVVWGDRVAEELVRHGVERVRVVPFGYDPTVYRPPDKAVEPEWDVTLIGQFYANRLPYAEAVADLRALVSGAGWTRGASGGPAAACASERTYRGDDVCRLYWRSRIAFNILADCNVPHHNMRTFEIPASGTVMVATRTPEHEALFGDGAVLVDTPAEARREVLALLAAPERADAISRAGFERVRPHTYAARMTSVLEPWAGGAVAGDGRGSAGRFAYDADR